MNNSTNANEPFSPKFIEHFLNPQNVGEIENADGFARIGDPTCGDYVKVWISIADEVITDYKYKVFGCDGAIATTSAASVLAIGKHLKDAVKLSDDDVVKMLGGVPENKQHCSLLGINALRAAIADFLVKDNHKKYISRIEKYRETGYDIPKHREDMADHLDNISKEEKILDIGTGKGHLAMAIARKGYNCISIDKSPDEIYIARLNAIYHQVDDIIEFEEQDARQLKYPDNSFGVVICADTIHHFIQPEAVFNEMIRVCKPDGLLILSDINENGQDVLQKVHKEEGREHFHTGWMMAETKKWFEMKGFKIKQIEQPCETMLVIQKIE